MFERARVPVRSNKQSRNNTLFKNTMADSNYSMSSPRDQILFLHGTVGNHGTQRMLKSGRIQAVLKIGRPDNIYKQESKTTYNLGMKVIKHPDGKLEIEVTKKWEEGSGISSTILGMAEIAGVSSEILIKEMIDCGAYRSAKQVRENFIVGTRIVVGEGSILEISVRGRVYKTGGRIKPDFNYFLEEGAKIFRKAGFGLSAGAAFGNDPEDSYDGSTWQEDKKRRGVIRAKVIPWIAMERLVRDVDKDVPKAGGGTTRWRFDCFEFVPLIRLYAYWRTMNKTEFNKNFAPLELGFHANTRLKWQKKSPTSEVHGEEPFYYEGEDVGGIILNPVKVPIGKSWGQLLRDAPAGTQVTWSNQDAAKKCGDSPNLPFCAFIHENTTKLGQDRYAAHPLGIVSENYIKRKMAAAVFGYNEKAVPPGYIERYIYISSMRYPQN